MFGSRPSHSTRGVIVEQQFAITRRVKFDPNGARTCESRPVDRCLTSIQQRTSRRRFDTAVAASRSLPEQGNSRDFMSNLARLTSRPAWIFPKYHRCCTSTGRFAARLVTPVVVIVNARIHRPKFSIATAESLLRCGRFGGKSRHSGPSL